MLLPKIECLEPGGAAPITYVMVRESQSLAPKRDRLPFWNIEVGSSDG
jgi:hypothetical protein